MNTIHHMLEPNPSPAPRQPDSTITLQVPTAQAMHELGERLARSLHGGEVILLSGPLGAGKTTLAQGLGEGLGIQEPIVSPTFTIARELDGTLADGTPAHLIHVDAYRLDPMTTPQVRHRPTCSSTNSNPSASTRNSKNRAHAPSSSWNGANKWQLRSPTNAWRSASKDPPTMCLPP